MKKPAWDDQFYDRLRTFLDATNSETDRGRALVAASLIEEMLNELLRGFLLNNSASKKLIDQSNGPLATFAAKSCASRALGLISHEEFSDIELVRRIRNDFAHNVMCSFDDEKIRRQAAQLKIGMSELDALERGHEARVGDPKQRFSMVITSLVISLYNRAHHVKRERLVDRTWPQ